MCSTSKIQTSPIKYITSHRISCCSVAFIEIKFQQKLCFNYQVLMLPNHSQRQCFKTDQLMKNSQILSVHSLICCPNVVSSEGGMNRSSYEPIIGSVKFDVYSWKYSTLHIGIRIWGESAHYTKGM